MALSLDDFITLISFGISVVAVTIVISLYYSWDKRLKKSNHDTQVSPTTNDTAVEVSAIVSEFTQRLRRLEESLVDQKVKMEILELRASRTAHEAVALGPVAYSRVGDELNSFDNPERPSSERIGLQSGVRTPPQKDRPEQDKKLGVTEMELSGSCSKVGGRSVPKKSSRGSGRTREHTARMMNSLYHDGLVERDVIARPFSYSITEKGRDLVNG